MAKGPKRRRRGSGPDADALQIEDARTPREKIIDAMMLLLAERSVGRIGFADIAERAGVSLVDIRRNYSSKTAILADFSKLIDERFLEAAPPKPMDADARDRLFDAMMRRFDALAPYRQGVRELARAASGNFGLACLLHDIAFGAQKWTLAAAGI